jgi:hypothetical protein
VASEQGEAVAGQARAETNRHMADTWRELEERANEPDDEDAKEAEVA